MRRTRGRQIDTWLFGRQNRDRRQTCPARFAAHGQLRISRVLHRQDSAERLLQPPFQDPVELARAIGRIHECDVIRSSRDALDKGNRVAIEDANLVARA
jgi:hypothetical protein